MRNAPRHLDAEPISHKSLRWMSASGDRAPTTTDPPSTPTDATPKTPLSSAVEPSEIKDEATPSILPSAQGEEEIEEESAKTGSPEDELRDALQRFDRATNPVHNPVGVALAFNFIFGGLFASLVALVLLTPELPQNSTKTLAVQLFFAFAATVWVGINALICRLGTSRQTPTTTTTTASNEKIE